MQNLKINQPAKINNSKAQDVIFNGFRQLFRDFDASSEMLCGVSQVAKVGEFEVSAFLACDGLYRVNVYTKGATSPCATAQCDEFDA